tara:strand:+ start:111 stop:371 length:261 start_codon:yes stop_codon:yes gene_type:complete
MNIDSLTQNAKPAIIQNSLKSKKLVTKSIKMKEERYLKDREAIIRAHIWKEITSSCKGLRTELGYTNVQIVDFLKEITKTFERDLL